MWVCERTHTFTMAIAETPPEKMQNKSMWTCEQTRTNRHEKHHLVSKVLLNDEKEIWHVNSIKKVLFVLCTNMPICDILYLCTTYFQFCVDLKWQKYTHTHIRQREEPLNGGRGELYLYTGAGFCSKRREIGISSESYWSLRATIVVVVSGSRV